MKRIIFTIIYLGLLLGLGFNIYIVFFFWRAYFLDHYYWTIVVNKLEEFWLEFVFFNASIIIILIAIILLSMSLEVSNANI